jgi:hypothetical protein
LDRPSSRRTVSADFRHADRQPIVTVDGRVVAVALKVRLVVLSV